MVANQTQIPVIQTQDQNMTQLQQNANKVLRNIYNQLTELEVLVLQNTVVGDVKLSSLSLSDFQDLSGTDWIEANGQSSVGTTYELVTGSKVVPTVTVSGVNSYIKVN